MARRYYGSNRHLKKADAFSRQIGGSDRDVKRYFFNMPSSDLNRLFDEYGKEYGEQAKSYAKKTFQDWKSGNRDMSGLVAERLFNLVPSYMPITQKYELTENMWKHFGPASQHYYSVGPSADVHSLALMIAEKLNENVTIYTIPESVKSRFKWLSAGDITVEEQLLNYLRQQQKGLAIQKVQDELPVLQRQILLHGDKTRLARSEIRIHRHVITVSINKDLADKIQEGFYDGSSLKTGKIPDILMHPLMVILAIYLILMLIVLISRGCHR